MAALCDNGVRVEDTALCLAQPADAGAARQSYFERVARATKSPTRPAGEQDPASGFAPSQLPSHGIGPWGNAQNRKTTAQGRIE